MNGVIAIREGWAPRTLTLCVSFCVPPSLNLNENPYRSATSVREKNISKPIQTYNDIIKPITTYIKSASPVPPFKIQIFVQGCPFECCEKLIQKTNVEEC